MKLKNNLVSLTVLCFSIGVALSLSCGDDGNDNGHVNKAPLISQVIYNSPSFENCGRFITDHDIEVIAEVTDSDDGVNTVYVDEKRGSETEYTSHEMDKIDTDVYSIFLTGFTGPTNLTSRVRAKDNSGASTTSDIENILVYVNNAPSTPTISPGDNLGGWEGDLYMFTASSTDPESDDISYQINDNIPDPDVSFNNDTGYFEWRADCNDAGDYTVNVTAIDKCGKSSTSKSVSVTVWDVPSCSEPTN